MRSDKVLMFVRCFMCFVEVETKRLKRTSMKNVCKKRNKNHQTNHKRMMLHREVYRALLDENFHVDIKDFYIISSTLMFVCGTLQLKRKDFSSEKKFKENFPAFQFSFVLKFISSLFNGRLKVSITTSIFFDGFFLNSV